MAQIFPSLSNQTNSGLKVMEEITHGDDGASKLFPLLCYYHSFISKESLQGRGHAPIIISQDIPEVTHFQDTTEILQT